MPELPGEPMFTGDVVSLQKNNDKHSDRRKDVVMEDKNANVLWLDRLI